jgi:hypothetical protein
MPGLSSQEYLFQRIKEKLPVNASLADVIAERLFISNDSAYRRIRGETPLVLEEARVLCEAFGLSLDELLSARPDTISFISSEVTSGDNSFKDYLTGILNNFKFIMSAQEKEIYYLSKDIPVFQNFLFRPLFAFRYFFWMKSIIQHPDFVRLQFSTDMLPPDIEALGTEIMRYYTSIPSTEIWNSEAVNSLISQVEYYREAGYFKSEEEITRIYEALQQFLEHIRIEAETGRKFMPGESPSMKQDNFRFFYNRVVLGDNTILVQMQGKKIVYLPYDVLNYMITRDERFCESVYEKLQTLMRRATMLSTASEKQRNIFFNMLLRKIPLRHSITNHNSL